MSEENKTEAVADVNENNSVALGVADLQNAAQVIDVAVSRGAFRANEIAQVGEVYNRITAFIQSVQEQQKEASNTTPEAAA
jgi:hypothetical protein